MPTKYRWQKIISNTYLGKTQVVRGMTRAEVEQKATVQQAKWAQQEGQRRAQYQAQQARQVQQDYLKTLEAQAQDEDKEVHARLAALQELLVRGLQLGTPFDWNGLKQHRQYPPFHFQEQPPAYELVTQSLRVPAPQPVFEALLASKRQKREQMEAQARATFASLTAQYEAPKHLALQTYEQQKQAYERSRDEYNASIDERRQRFENGDPDEIVWCITRVLRGLALPEDYGRDFDVAFDGASGIAVLTMQLPTLEEVPRIGGYRFVKTRRAIEPIELKSKDFDELYDSLVLQIALLTIYRVFRGASSPALHAIVFNGWVTGVDRKTGNDFTSCILSVQASRETFMAMRLDRVDPKECIRSLKGLVAGPLAQLAPVRPIMELNREDTRFIESREILANLNATDNLATMDWEDFEHLVRELFGRIFGGDGAEVRVTQASRDRGVDAIAFDPDPIRGGKFVIQAKRYNNVVPVSAVRDLYGTMINEGAAKGILVTTSHFGQDSRDFAKDKPITLIDGPKLVYMFQEQGYEVRIELQK